MKKLISVVVVLMLVGVLAATAAFAAGPQSRGSGWVGGSASCPNYGQCYLDQDGDGVCDYHTQDHHGWNYTDENGDGVCDYAGQGCHARRQMRLAA